MNTAKILPVNIPSQSPSSLSLVVDTVPDSMRIALVLDPFSIFLKDGVRLGVKWGNHAPQLAREFLGRGHVVRGFGAPPGVIPRSGEDLDPESGAHGGGALRTLKAFRPDVLVAYDALSPAAMRAARAARSLKAGLVLVESGPVGGGSWRERILGRLGELAWGRLVRKTAHAVVALDEVARVRALSEGFDQGLVTVVPHGVDAGAFRPGLTSTLVARRQMRGRIMLYVGRLLPERGLELLLLAFARTVAQGGDWNLVVAGEGPELPRLRAQADRLGVAASVHWLGRPRDEELPGLFGASTLVAAPYLSDASNGIQVLRAMACGVPVIASDLPRLQGLITSEESGLLIAPGNLDAWVEGIRRASGSPLMRKRWGTEARNIVADRFAWESVSLRFETILAAAQCRAREESESTLQSPDVAPS